MKNANKKAANSNKSFSQFSNHVISKAQLKQLKGGSGDIIIVEEPIV